MTAPAKLRPALPAPPPPSTAEIPALLGLDAASSSTVATPDRPLDLRMRIAGFGGQGVLTLGYILAEAGMEAGYQVSWLPSYGPEMRSGTSNCHVRLSNEPIASPLVSRPNVLLALNEPSLRKFLPDVEPGGIVLYNGDTLPDDCARPDLRIVARHFSALADGLGDPKVANVVMLGALLEATGLMDPEQIVEALRVLVKNKKVSRSRLYSLCNSARMNCASSRFPFVTTNSGPSKDGVNGATGNMGNTLQYKVCGRTLARSAIAETSWLPFPLLRSFSPRTERSRQGRAFRRSVALTASTVRHNRTAGKGSLLPLHLSVTHVPGLIKCTHVAGPDLTSPLPRGHGRKLLSRARQQAGLTSRHHGGASRPRRRLKLQLPSPWSPHGAGGLPAREEP